MKDKAKIDQSSQGKSKKLSHHLKWYALSLFLIVSIVSGLFIMSRNNDTKLIQARVKACKYCVLGKPIDKNFYETVDIKALRLDAKNGNIHSQKALELYLLREAMNESIILGKPTPSALSNEIDLALLKADSEAGYEHATQQIELIAQRDYILSNVKLGEPMPENTMDQVNTNLLNKDANAGNIQIREALSLLENRTISKQLCTLGKPFKLDFYDNVDRKLIEKDANAGNTTAQNILKLADVRIKSNERTIIFLKYFKDFPEHVDMELLKKDADAGNANSQFIWGRLHAVERVHDVERVHSAEKLQNIGVNDVKVNYQIALKYYTLAAEQNHGTAITNIGTLYNTGKGVEKDYYKGVEFHKKATLLNNPYADYNLALSYRNGLGVPRDIEKYRELLRKSADSNCCRAIYQIGYHHHYGRYGFKKDLKLAEIYYLKAADQLDTRSIANLCGLIEDTRSEKAQQHKDILEVYRKAAMKNHAESMASYGRMFMRGQGTEKDYKEGIKWIKKSAAHNNSVGLGILADMYRQGKGVEKNFPEAVRLHKILADRAQGIAMLNLGIIYSQGKPGVPMDRQQAIKYLQMGVDHNYALTARRLADIYLEGEPSQEDINKAITVLEHGVRLRDNNSLQMLGIVYIEPKYGKLNIDQGVSYLNKAIDNGSTPAMVSLASRQLEGDVLPKNEDEALRLLRLAKAKNNKYAFYYIGKIHELGLCGIKKNIPWAIQMYKKAAGKYPPAKEALYRLTKK